MSNFGQVAFTVVGTFVGSFFGYPALGLTLGSMAGQALFPTQLDTVRGPKLDDLTVQTSTIGAPVPLVYGTFAVAGNIIWSTDLVATTTTEEVGGKGGPSQKVETTTYAVSFAVGLCNNPIVGIIRIWAGGKLIYDRRPQMAGEDDTTFAARENAADLVDAGMTVYLGSETQLADPTIESHEGVGNVPGYRGLAYVVFTNFQLADYGNNLAGTMLRFEVSAGGAAEFTETTEYSAGIVFPWLSSLNSATNDRNDHFIGTLWTRNNSSGTLITSGPASGIMTDIEALADLSAYIFADVGEEWAWSPIFYSGSMSLTSTVRRTTNKTGSGGAGDDKNWLYTRFCVPASETILADYDYDAMTGTTEAQKLSNLGLSVGDVVYIESASRDPSIYKKFAGSLIGSPINRMWNNGNASSGIVDSGGGRWYRLRCPQMAINRVARKPDNPCHPQGLPAYPDAPGYAGFCVIGSEYVESEAWITHSAGSGVDALILQRLGMRATFSGSPQETYPDQVGPLVLLGDPNFSSSSFWTAQYNAAVAAGTMPAGLTYGVDYPVFPDNNEYYELTINRGTVTGGPAPLSLIVGDLCSRVGLESTQYNVSDLDSILVPGYAVGNVMDAVSAIQPLRLYGFFDGVESGGVLKFVTRGKAVVATLALEDLGAHIADSGGASTDPLEVIRSDDVSLPKIVRIKYIQVDKDYEAGEQSASRQITLSKLAMDIQLPVAMTDAKAAQIAEVSLYEAWASRSSYTLSLDNYWLALEPTDRVILPDGSALKTARIITEDYELPGLKRLQLVGDDIDYSSFAVGGSGEEPTQEFQAIDNSIAYYLDLPALRDVDNEAGYYIATRQSSTGSWPGAAHLRSNDGGASYASIGSVVTQAITGTVDVALPAGPSTVFDEGNTLTVTLDRGTLSTVLEAAVLAGANSAAIGLHGRWEIIQFREAVLLDTSPIGTTWLLTGLLRGRKGTEHSIGTSQVGDDFVLISGNGVIRAVQETSAIGSQRLLKAVTFGFELESATVSPFTGDAESLKPYSPVHISGTRDGSGNLTISWIRRGRLGRELPSGTDIALSEESEAYDIDIMSGGSPEVVRTLTSTTNSVAYSAANQTTDFGSAQASVTVRIYQRSATVGRGYPGEATI